MGFDPAAGVVDDRPQDIEDTAGVPVKYPLIGDTDLGIAKLYGMLPAGAGETCEGRTAADNATVRNVYVIGPDKKIKLVLSYPMSTGRNFDEVLRVIDSMQLTAKHKVATPVNWKQGDDVIIIPGTKSVTRVQENMAAANVSLSAADVAALSQAFPADIASGTRYPAGGMKGVYI